VNTIDGLALLIVRGDTSRLEEGRRLAIDYLRPAIVGVFQAVDKFGSRYMIYNSAFYEARHRSRIQYRRKSRGHR